MLGVRSTPWRWTGSRGPACSTRWHGAARRAAYPASFPLVLDSVLAGSRRTSGDRPALTSLGSMAHHGHERGRQSPARPGRRGLPPEVVARCSPCWRFGPVGPVAIIQQPGRRGGPAALPAPCCGGHPAPRGRHREGRGAGSDLGALALADRLRGRGAGGDAAVTETQSSSRSAPRPRSRGRDVAAVLRLPRHPWPSTSRDGDGECASCSERFGPVSWALHQREEPSTAARAVALSIAAAGASVKSGRGPSRSTSASRHHRRLRAHSAANERQVVGRDAVGRLRAMGSSRSAARAGRGRWVLLDFGDIVVHPALGGRIPTPSSDCGRTAPSSSPCAVNQVTQVGRGTAVIRRRASTADRLLASRGQHPGAPSASGQSDIPLDDVGLAQVARAARPSPGSSRHC